MWKSALTLIVGSALLIDLCSSVDENMTDSDKSKHLPYKCENKLFHLELVTKSAGLELSIKCKSENARDTVNALRYLSKCNTSLDKPVTELHFEKCIPGDESLITIKTLMLANLQTFTINGDGRKTVIQDFSVIKNQLKDITSIKSLSLVNLGLKSVEITNDIFPNLDVLNLTRNKLTVFPKFQSGSNIHTLDLSDNDLKNLGEKVHCRNLDQLKKLIISGNKHFELSNARSFEGCNELSELRMANIGINKIDRDLWRLEKLELLDLSNNNINTILLNDIVTNIVSQDSTAFSILLPNCGIENIYITAALEYNKYSYKHFKMLDLSNNKLTVVNETILGVLNQTDFVREMKLGNNPWKCRCDSSTKNFISFANTNSKKIMDVDRMKCDQMLVRDVTDAKLCGTNHLLAWSMLLLTVGLLFVVGGVLYVRHLHNRR